VLADSIQGILNPINFFQRLSCMRYEKLYYISEFASACAWDLEALVDRDGLTILHFAFAGHGEPPLLIAAFGPYIRTEIE
jgi:hypothetical protein